MVALSWFDMKYTNLSKESISEKAEFDKFYLNDAILYNICQFTHHDRIRNEILMKELSLDDAQKYGTSIEMAQREGMKMKRNEVKRQDDEINAVKRKPGEYSKTNRLRQRNERAAEKNWETRKNWDMSCSRCGRPHSRDQATCRARKQRCHKCGLIGHFAVKCRNTRKVNAVNDQPLAEEEESESSEPEEY